MPSVRLDSDSDARISLHLANLSAAASRRPRRAVGLRKRPVRSSIMFRGRNVDLGALELVGLGLGLVFKLDIDGWCDNGEGPRRIDGLFDWPG